MSEWQGTKERTAQAFRQEPLWDLLGVQPGREFRADLHAHTTLSDGSDSFLELMGKARVQGVTHLAVTNHDTTVGLDAIRQQAAEHGFSVVCGVEISAWDSTAKRRVHLVGLGMPADAPAVCDLCSDTLERRTANTAWQMRQLLDAGYDVDVEYAAQLAGQSTGFYKQHLMAAVTDAVFSSAESCTRHCSRAAVLRSAISSTLTCAMPWLLLRLTAGCQFWRIPASSTITRRCLRSLMRGLLASRSIIPITTIAIRSCAKSLLRVTACFARAAPTTTDASARCRTLAIAS